MGKVAIPVEMKRWDGGETAPADWDGGAVLLRNGQLIVAQRDTYSVPWKCDQDDLDVIAYMPTPNAKLDDSDATVLKAMARAACRYNWPRASEADIEEMWDAWVGEARYMLAAYRAHQEAF